MNASTLQISTYRVLPQLELVSFAGPAPERSDVLGENHTGDWSLEDICYSTSSAQAAAKRLAERTHKECWVVDRSNGDKVTFKFKPAAGIDLSV
jgi:hypothetical protein